MCPSLRHSTDPCPQQGRQDRVEPSALAKATVSLCTLANSYFPCASSLQDHHINPEGDTHGTDLVIRSMNNLREVVVVAVLQGTWASSP